MLQNKRSQVSPLQSILAGGCAGGVESLVTYPTEYIKTRQQLQRQGSGSSNTPIRILVSTLKENGISRLYTGGTAFCMANALKSGVRFFAFDTARRKFTFLRSNDGKTSSAGNLAAGLIAGVAESVLVVTPGETLKTKLVDDRAGPKIYRSTSHAIQHILRNEGPPGLYRGVVPVTLKQSFNAMVRFTSYNFLLDKLGAVASKHQRAKSLPVTPIAGAFAGIITVYATMPFDTTKIRLQAVDARSRYRGFADCIRSIIVHEGPVALWKGTTPRLVRLSVSGAVSFSIYEHVVAATIAWRI